MTFGYECRPSFWRTMRSNSHLVIAAIGTASFLGVAGLALWLAMPSIERPAFAASRQEPVVHQVAAAPAIRAAATSGKADKVTPETAAAETLIPALKSNDVRWKDPNAAEKPASLPSAQTAQQVVNAEATAAPADDGASTSLSAFAAANRAQINGDQGQAAPNPDASKTAAIPTPKSQELASQAAPDPKDEADQATTTATPPDANTAQGHILRAVTMRSGPKQGAAALTTVPAKTAVQLVTCNQWCQIVYEGKRGWVYNSFVKRDD